MLRSFVSTGAVMFGALTVCALDSLGDTSTYKDASGNIWTYAILSSTDKTAKLTQGSYGNPCIAKTTSGAIKVPSSVKYGSVNYSVTTLDYGSFTNCSAITKVTLPSSVSKVLGAFRNCTALTTISLAAPKISFNESAFVNCPSFTAFELTGDAVDSYAVEGGVLYNAAKSQLIRVPIGLASVSIPESVTTISQYAFAHSAVRSLALPAALQEISVSAFTKASKLESFSIPDANAIYATRNGVLYSKDLKTLIRVPPACTNLIVLAGVTNIADNACIACAALKSVTCPASLKRLETYAFQGIQYDSQRPKITFKGNLPTLDSQQTLGNLTYEAIIRYPSRYAENWKSYLNAHGYELHEPVPFIGSVIIFGSTGGTVK